VIIMGKGRGRRGRRTKDMIKTAGERIDLLFSYAEKEGLNGDMELANRYVSLAFTIAKRYNVRLLPAHKAFFCRKCQTYQLESRTCRTRIHNGRVVKKCLNCGNLKRIVISKDKHE